MTPHDEALREFNLSAAPWRPFRQWHQLTMTEKCGVALRAVEIEDARTARGKEVAEVAERVANVLAMSLSCTRRI